MKIILSIIFSITLIKQMIVTSFASFGEEKIIDKLRGSVNPLDQSIMSSISYVLFFLYFVAVIYGIYGGFLILTAAEDDEKVGKGKKIIFQAIIGLIVIFLAGPIANFFLNENTGVLTS